MTPTVRAVTRAAASAGSRLSVAGSTSAKTGMPPASTTASAVAKKVKAGTITSSPAFTPSARRARTSASVPFATPTHPAAPKNSANALSNSRTSGPCTNAVAANTSRQRSATSSAIRSRARPRSK